MGAWGLLHHPPCLCLPGWHRGSRGLAYRADPCSNTTQLTHLPVLQPTQLSRPKTHLLGPRPMESISDHRVPVCGHPAPGIRHLGKVTLPLAKVKLPPSQSTGQYQQGTEWERRQSWPAQGEGMLSPLHRGPLIAGNQVLTEYLWDWHLGVVPLGSSRPLGDQRGNEEFLNPCPCPSPVTGPGDSSLLTVPSNAAGISRRAARGPRLAHGTSTHGKDGCFRHT